MNKTIIIVLTLLIAIGAWSFGQAKTDETAAAVKMRSVVDDASRTVSIPERPQRVIALNSSNIDLYYGAGGKVIAKPNTVTLTKEVMDAVNDLPSVGETASPSVEQLIALKPDLVLGLNLPFNQSLVPALEKAGIPILLQSLGNYQDVSERLKFYGELSGQPDKAKQSIDSLGQKLNAALAKNKDNLKPKVLVLFGSPNSYTMALPKSFSGNLLELLGAENIAANQSSISKKLPYVAFNLEFVVQANPEIIMLIVHGNKEDGKRMQEEMAKNSAWQGIRAVNENRVYILPYHLFGINPGTQTGESIEYLGEILYGEKHNERAGS